MGNLRKMQKDNLLKTKRILKAKQKLSGGPGLLLLASGVKSPLFPPVSYSTARNTLNIN